MRVRLETRNYDDHRARGSTHPPVVVSRPLTSGLGELPVGLLLAKGAAGAVPYEEIAAEAIGAGDAATTAFTGTLGKAPVLPGSVAITDGTETLSDDGCGRLVGSAGGTGTAHYGTGAVAVTFAAAPANGTSVTVAYANHLDGVLDETTDTAVSDSGLVIIHGSTRADMLKVGATAQAAPSSATLSRLQEAGIYAE